MKYEFEDEEGIIHEISMPMSEAPSIGSIIHRDGRLMRRIASLSVQVDTGTVRSQYPYVSNALPRNLAGCKVDRLGKPIVESKRHEREIMARHDYAKD